MRVQEGHGMRIVSYIADIVSLEKGGSVAAEYKGIVIQKWKDKRNVFVLSTRYTDEMRTVKSRKGDVEKPKNIIQYKYKSYIDISDQLKSYNSSLRRGLKWYRKLAIEMLLETAIVNAHSLHQHVANEKMSNTKFKEYVASELTQITHSEKCRHGTTE